MIVARELSLPGLRHGFFTREGGHSTGMFASLNCGLGSGDDLQLVQKNRALVSANLGVSSTHLVSAFQVHGSNVIQVTQPLAERPKADGLVSNVPGMAIGVLTADCGSILFADPTVGVIGAAHAGWKGALNGVHVSVISAMEKLGARRENIVAVLGPMISQANYEVGLEFPEPFLARDGKAEKYFIRSSKNDHFLFDLNGYLIDAMNKIEIGHITTVGMCTYADERRFFSYRRATHRSEPDYGRQISAIAITP